MAHRVSPQASVDLDEIWLYPAKQSSALEIADRLIDSITSHFSLLASFPPLGRRQDKGLRPGVRSFPVGEYVILYSLHESDVVIDHVVRGSRNIRMILRD